MKVFVTGATGFIGSAIVRELGAAGHHILGLARSDSAAAALAAAGAEAHRGSLEDLDSLRRGAAAADGVIHAAFIHDFSQYAAAAATDRQAIETMGTALAGSDRPLVVTAGVVGVAAGRVITETDTLDPTWTRASEAAALPFAERGVRVAVVRLPPSVHGAGDYGFVPRLVEIARETGVSAYVGDGSQRWSAVHRLDAARLFRLALEDAQPGAVVHGVADEGVPVREIAAVIGRRLQMPVVSLPAEDAGDHFGWLGPVFAMDVPASSAWTQQRLGWHPAEPALLADLDQDYYFKNEK